MKVARLPALRTGRLYPPGNISGTHFCQRLSQPQGHSATGRIMSMKKIQCHHRESNPRPSSLQRSVSTKCTTSSVPFHTAGILISHFSHTQYPSFLKRIYRDIFVTQMPCVVCEEPERAPSRPNHIIKIQASVSPARPFIPEDKGIQIYRKVGKSLPVGTESDPHKIKSSKPKTVNIAVFNLLVYLPTHPLTILNPSPAPHAFRYPATHPSTHASDHQCL